MTRIAATAPPADRVRCVPTWGTCRPLLDARRACFINGYSGTGRRRMSSAGEPSIIPRHRDRVHRRRDPVVGQFGPSCLVWEATLSPIPGCERARAAIGHRGWIAERGRHHDEAPRSDARRVLRQDERLGVGRRLATASIRPGPTGSGSGARGRQPRRREIRCDPVASQPQILSRFRDDLVSEHHAFEEVCLSDFFVPLDTRPKQDVTNKVKYNYYSCGDHLPPSTPESLVSIHGKIDHKRSENDRQQKWLHDQPEPKKIRSMKCGCYVGLYWSQLEQDGHAETPVGRAPSSN